MSQTTAERVERRFVELFGRAPSALARAPGRVNLIGEHTDYNHGFVLPMAIDRYTYLAFAAADEPRVTLHAVALDDTRDFSLSELVGHGADQVRASRARGPGGPGGWIEYARGVAWAMAQEARTPRGLIGVIASDVPMGAGLSSSAAFELCVARALAALDGVAWNPASMARLAQRAERDWVGVSCGIMDQLVCAAGQRGHALFIDCRSEHATPVPVPADAAIFVLDTGTRRQLVDSRYAELRAGCERAAARLGVAALRDISPAELGARAHELDAASLALARHVVTENQRTVDASRALVERDLMRVGALMDQSHASLRDDFQVSSPALDAMVACARGRGALGARLSGAGFAGCCVALVERARAPGFADAVLDDYARRVPRDARTEEPRAYLVEAADGATLGGDA